MTLGLIAGVRFLLDRMKLVPRGTESWGHYDRGALLDGTLATPVGPTVAVLSGGNVEWEGLRELLRRCQLRVTYPRGGVRLAERRRRPAAGCCASKGTARREPIVESGTAVLPRLDRAVPDLVLLIEAGWIRTIRMTSSRAFGPTLRFRDVRV